MSELVETETARSVALRIVGTDGAAGLAVGIALVVLRPWVAELYGMPREWVTAIGVANLVYGAYSATLAVRALGGTWPSRFAIDVLVAANALWTVVCVGLLVSFHGEFGALGLAHIALEGAFTGALAVVEWRRVRPLTRC